MACKPMKFSLIFLKKWNPLVPGILEIESQDLSSLSFSDWIFSLEQCIALMLGQNSLNSQECFENTRQAQVFFSYMSFACPTNPINVSFSIRCHIKLPCNRILQNCPPAYCISLFELLLCFITMQSCISSWILGYLSLKSFKSSLKMTTAAYLSRLRLSDTKTYKLCFSSWSL